MIGEDCDNQLTVAFRDGRMNVDAVLMGFQLAMPLAIQNLPIQLNLPSAATLPVPRDVRVLRSYDKLQLLKSTLDKLFARVVTLLTWGVGSNLAGWRRSKRPFAGVVQDTQIPPKFRRISVVATDKYISLAENIAEKVEPRIGAGGKTLERR